MKRWVFLIVIIAGLAGCRRYEPAPELSRSGMAGHQEEERRAQESDRQEGVQPENQDAIPGEDGQTGNGKMAPVEEGGMEAGSPAGEAAKTELGEAKAAKTGEKPVQEIVISTKPERTPVKVKGIYVSAYVAGMNNLMEEIIAQIDRTELNAVVIDVKDDNGRITFAMDSPSAQGIGACVNYIPDIQALMTKLKEHNIYLIARIPAFRDPFLAEARPDWCCKLADGSVFRDRNKLAWVNPYKKEVWNYLVEIGKMAGEVGFDEIQYDYIRFCTEKGMQKVVFDEADTQGRSRQEIILEFVQYAYEQLTEEGLFVSADVFGVVMGGGADAHTVGQDYKKMAASLDYICPMIYPSHYGDGYFGIAHPDTQPYQTVSAALAESKTALAQPESGISSGGVSESGISGSRISESGVSGSRISESGISGSGVAKSGISEGGVSGSGVAKSGISEGGVSGSGVAESGISEDGVSGSGVAKSGISENEVSESGVSTSETRGQRQAIVRPWLQDFTASYLKHYISYGPQQVREQIQAVYDAGYEEWILWDAKVTYDYDGLLPALADERSIGQGGENTKAGGILPTY